MARFAQLAYGVGVMSNTCSTSNPVTYQVVRLRQLIASFLENVALTGTSAAQRETRV